MQNDCNLVRHVLLWIRERNAARFGVLNTKLVAKCPRFWENSHSMAIVTQQSVWHKRQTFASVSRKHAKCLAKNSLRLTVIWKRTDFSRCASSLLTKAFRSVEINMLRWAQSESSDRLAALVKAFCFCGTSMLANAIQLCEGKNSRRRSFPSFNESRRTQQLSRACRNKQFFMGHAKMTSVHQITNKEGIELESD